MFLGMITGAVTTVMIVDINRAAQAGDITRAFSLFRKIAEKTALFLMPVMIFFIFAGSNLIHFLFTEKYEGAILVFIIYLLYMPVRCVIYGPLFIALGKTSVVLRREITALVLNAVLSVISVKYLGAIGAALATILVTYLYSVPCNLYLLHIYSNIAMRDILPLKHIALCIILSLPGGLLAWEIDQCYGCDYYLLRLIVMGGVFTLVTLLLYRYFFKIRFSSILAHLW